MLQIPGSAAAQRERLAGKHNLKVRFLLAILALGAAVLLAIFVSRPVSAISTQTVSACGSTGDGSSRSMAGVNCIISEE